MKKYLVLCELVEGGEWIALKRLFEALKKNDGSNYFSIIAFKKNHKPDLSFFKSQIVLNYSTASNPLSYAKKSIKDFIKVRRAVTKSISLDKPDFILAVDYISFLAALSIRPKDTKLIFLFHGIRSALLRNITEVNYWQIVIKFLERVSWVFADAVTVPSESAKKYLLKGTSVLPRKPTIFLVSNIVPLLFFKKRSSKEKENLRKKINLSKNEKVLLYAGRMGRYKGIPNLLLAMPLILKKFPNITLVVAYPTSSSEKDVEKRVRQIVKKLKLQTKVKFYKDPSVLELSTLYQISHLSILPSEIENAPLSIIESLASGTPVIGTKVGNIPQLQKKITPTLILDNNSPLEISKKVIGYFNFTKEKIESIRKKSSTIVKIFSNQSAVRGFTQMINHF